MCCNDPALKRYIRSISSEIPSGKMRKRIISQIRDSIVEYIQENPEADFETVQSHFGTPQEIAASYMYAEETPVLLRKMNINKKVLAIVAGVMAVIFALWFCIIAREMYIAHHIDRGYIATSTSQHDLK